MTKKRAGSILLSNRRRLKLSLREAAGIAKVGFGHLSDVERGRKMPGLEIARKLCKTYGVSLSVFD